MYRYQDPRAIYQVESSVDQAVLKKLQDECNNERSTIKKMRADAKKLTGTAQVNLLDRIDNFKFQACEGDSDSSNIQWTNVSKISYTVGAVTSVIFLVLAIFKYLSFSDAIAKWDADKKEENKDKNPKGILNAIFSTNALVLLEAMIFCIYIFMLLSYIIAYFNVYSNMTILLIISVILGIGLFIKLAKDANEKKKVNPFALKSDKWTSVEGITSIVNVASIIVLLLIQLDILKISSCYFIPAILAIFSVGVSTGLMYYRYPETVKAKP